MVTHIIHAAPTPHEGTPATCRALLQPCTSPAMATLAGQFPTVHQAEATAPELVLLGEVITDPQRQPTCAASLSPMAAIVLCAASLAPVLATPCVAAYASGMRDKRERENETKRER